MASPPPFQDRDPVNLRKAKVQDHGVIRLGLAEELGFLPIGGVIDGVAGVFLGSDLSQADWSAAVDAALSDFPTSPSVLQRFQKPAQVEAKWFDFAKNEMVPMKGRVRLCPYYFVSGEGDAARPQLGGVLATIVPADKKIVHGMTDAVLAPCSP